MITMFLTMILITSAAMSDLDLVGKGSSFEDNTALSFNPTLPSVANPPTPFSLDQSSPIPFDDSNAPTLFTSDQMLGDFMSTITNNDLDTSDAFLWDDIDGSINLWSETDNINESNFFFDDDDNDEGPFQLVDCSNSESLPAFDTLDTLPDPDIANSRLRQRDSSGEECKIPATTPPTNSRSRSRASPDGRKLEDQFKELLGDPQMLNRATTAANENPNHNTPCFVITDGRLPWGVCSSGRAGEQQRLAETFLTAAARGLAQWRLSRATLGTFLQRTL